jgi:hypothetical protein
MERLFERMQNIEDERNLDWIKVAAKTAKRKRAPSRAKAKR